MEKIKEYLASQYGVTGATLDYVVHPDTADKPEAEDPADVYETVDQEMMAITPYTGRSLWMTGARFGRSCPIFVAIILVLSISNLPCGPEMEGMLICSCLTISLGPTMWGIWPVKHRPSSLGPSTMEKRRVSPGKPMSEFILNNIQSSID
jgi:hypothetical protein